MSDEFHFDVFLSHAHDDIDFVRKLAEWLRTCGFRVWLAEEQLVPGSRFRAGLEQGIRECRDLLAVLTPGYCTRPWTQREVDLFDLGADLTERRVLGVHIGNTHPGVMDQVFNVSQRIPWKNLAFDPEGMWLLHCGLMRKKPGPKPEWARNGSLLVGSHVTARPASTELVVVALDEPWIKPDEKDAIGSLTDRCLRGAESRWGQSFAELQKRLQAMQTHCRESLMCNLWAIGRAEQAAILFAANGADCASYYGPWALLDSGCNSVARWILISRLMNCTHESEIWFSWGICDMAWTFLPAVAKKAPAGPLREHFIKLAAFANEDGLTFGEAEADYDYGVMITPWNHFHLTWLAVRLGDLSSARAHVRTLCETALQGDVRTGRFLTRICNWPVFQAVLTESKTMKSVDRARASLGLDEKDTIMRSRQRLEKIWTHVNRQQNTRNA